MKSLNGKMTQEMMEWLYKAIDERGNQIMCIFENGAAISTDGIRLHLISKEDLPEKIPNLPTSTKELLGRTIDANVIAKFSVNSKYLGDALSPFQGTVKIELTKPDEGELYGIKISNDIDDMIAFVACVKEKEVDNEQSG